MHYLLKSAFNLINNLIPKITLRFGLLKVSLISIRQIKTKVQRQNTNA